VIEREAPGLGEAMRRRQRPRRTARSGCFPGRVRRGGAGARLQSPRVVGGAVECLEAVLPALPHALELLAVSTPIDHELKRVTLSLDYSRLASQVEAENRAEPSGFGCKSRPAVNRRQARHGLRQPRAHAASRAVDPVRSRADGESPDGRGRPAARRRGVPAAPSPRRGLAAIERSLRSRCAGEGHGQRPDRPGGGTGEHGRRTASPNPGRVCIVDEHGAIAGEGWHRSPGAPHAEANALEAAGERARNGTPTSPRAVPARSRTPSCADALIAAGVRRVVVSLEDPDPRSQGAGSRGSALRPRRRGRAGRPRARGDRWRRTCTTAGRAGRGAS